MQIGVPAVTSSASIGLPARRAAPAWAKLCSHSQPITKGTLSRPTPRRCARLRCGRTRPARQASTPHSTTSSQGKESQPRHTSGVPKIWAMVLRGTDSICKFYNVITASAYSQNRTRLICRQIINISCHLSLPSPPFPPKEREGADKKAPPPLGLGADRYQKLPPLTPPKGRGTRFLNRYRRRTPPITAKKGSPPPWAGGWATHKAAT